MKPRLVCNCPEALRQGGLPDFKMYTCTRQVPSKDGETCDYCGYFVYRDYGTTEYKRKHLNAENETLSTERRKYEKSKRTPVSVWHKIDK